MCLPGYGMQGLDHLYMFVYPLFQSLLVNESLHLYKERVSVILLKVFSLLGDRRLILARRISKFYQSDNLRYRKTIASILR